jgi:Tfp pilus assembly protein PilF
MRRRVALSLLLVVATVAVYWRVTTFAFINYDDSGYVRDNSQVLAGLTHEGVVWAFTTASQANWHPLTWLSLQLDASLGGSSPRVYHTTNIVLHVVGVLLLFLLFDRMTGRPWRSALVAALFAVHPLHVESVAWVAERKDVLSTVLGLLAFHAWLGAVERPGWKSRALTIAAYAASLLAKPMLVSFPILLLLFDVWPLRRAEPWRRLVVEKLPYVALAAVSCIVTVVVQSKGGAMRSLTQYPFSARMGNAAVSYVLYLVKAIWPSGLSIYYPYPYDGLAAWEVGGAVLALAAVTFLCVRARRSAPYLFVGWLWYLVTLVPVIGIIQVGSQALADRYTYVPLIGPFVMLAFGLPDLSQRARPRVRRAVVHLPAVAALAMVVAFAAAAWRQAGYWRDSVTLFERSLAVTTDNAMAHNSLAFALFDRGEVDRAVEECEEAIRIAPEMGDAQSNLVQGYLAQGRMEEAAAHTREALLLRPKDARTHVNAGLIARMEGRDDDAMASFREAIRLDPDEQPAHLNYGAILVAHGRLDEAIVQFQEAVRLRPSDVRARKALVQTLEQR